MKHPVALACALAAVLGALSGGAASVLATRDRSAGAPRAELGPEARRELLDEIGRLRAAQRDLLERVTALEVRRAPAERRSADGFATSADLEALREEVRDRLAASPPGPGGPTDVPELERRVAEALRAIRHEEAVEGVRRKQEAQTARLDERVAQLSEWLTLDAWQEGEMRAILTAQDERDRELVRQWEAGVEDAVLGEAKRANREEFLTEVERVLAPDQWETFRERVARGDR